MFGTQDFAMEFLETIILFILVVVLFIGLVISLLKLVELAKSMAQNRKLQSYYNGKTVLPPTPEIIVVVDTAVLNQAK